MKKKLTTADIIVRTKSEKLGETYGESGEIRIAFAAPEFNVRWTSKDGDMATAIITGPNAEVVADSLCGFLWDKFPEA